MKPVRELNLTEWVPIAIWAAVIFTFSTSAFSAFNTAAILAPILKWLLPAISESSLSVANLTIRKAAHFTEFAILCGLLMRRPLKGRLFLAIILCIGYALTDESHQWFVPGRTASLYDVGLDTTGATFGGFLEAAINEIF